MMFGLESVEISYQFNFWLNTVAIMIGFFISKLVHKKSSTHIDFSVGLWVGMALMPILSFYNIF